MTKYHTGNPVGSADPRDLYDNAQNLDDLTNGDAPSYQDRLGQERKSWSGMASEFDAGQAERQSHFDSFLASSGYELVGEYAAGIEITAYNQIVRDAGELWRIAASTELPYITTGTGTPEGGALVSVGDAALRQELGLPVSGGGGAAMVNGAVIYVDSIADLLALNTAALKDGQNIYITQEGRAGEFVVKSGTPPSDPQQGVYVVLADGRYAKRQYSGKLSIEWFGGDVSAALAFYDSIVRTQAEDIIAVNRVRADILWGVNRLTTAFDAEKIRRNAGVPAGMHIGVRASFTPGTAGALSNLGRIYITSEADLKPGGMIPANSGTGTKDDPYVLANYRIYNGAGATSAGGFYWNDPDATYYIKLQNIEISGWNTAQVLTDSPATLFISQCEFFASSAPSVPDLIQVYRGSVECSQVLFSGLTDPGKNEKSGVHILAPNQAVNGGEYVKLRDCRFNTAKGYWDGGSQCVKVVQGAYSLDITDSEALNTGSVGTAASHFVTVVGDMTGGLTLRRNYIRGLRKTLWVPQNSPGLACVIDGATIEFCRMEDCFDSHILIFGALRNADIKFCDFLDVAVADKRSVSIQPQNPNMTGAPRDINVHNCKFSKFTGNKYAGNEVLESWYSENVDFAYNWVTQCPEDAFEHVGCINSNIRHSVADNCVGQIADYYGPETHGGLCEYIYGDCGDVAVVLTDVNGVTVSNIFAKSAGVGKPSVLLQQGVVAAGAGPNNCKVIGPLPLSESSASGLPFGTMGTVGTGNTAVWFERGDIKSYGSVDLAKFDPV